MPDIVTSIFKLENERGYFVPKLDIEYTEKGTGIQWLINCGGTRAYLIRIGEKQKVDFKEQAEDSHFMINRVTTALFLAGLGLFRSVSMGRLFFEDINYEELKIHSHLDLWNASTQKDETNGDRDIFEDWYLFICQDNLFRRAADDAYLALLNPIEAYFYIYRGMEWLLKAGNIGWRELADDIGISFKDIKSFKRTANFKLGQRHGIDSARKMRANLDNYGTLIADYLYGFCNVRKRADRNYKGVTPSEVAEIVKKALPLVPYP